MQLAACIDSISYRYPEESAPPVIQRFTLKIESGSTVALLGKSAIGKSTLLKLLAAVLDPDEGQIALFGELPSEIRRNGQIGFVPQDRQLLPWRTVEQNILFPPPRDHSGISLLYPLVSDLGINDILNKRPTRISGGQKSRVALARALVRRPRLLLLDEPFSSVDAMMREDLWDDLARVRGSETTTLLATHDIPEALRVATRIIVLGRRRKYDPGSVLVDIENHPSNEHNHQEGARSEKERYLREVLDA